MIDPKPRKRVKRREQRLDADKARDWKKYALRSKCRICGGNGEVGHHATSQQRIRNAGLGEFERWDVRNCVPLCRRCHETHHSRLRPIPFARLPLSALQFAEEHGFTDYLRRTYP